MYKLIITSAITILLLTQNINVKNTYASPLNTTNSEITTDSTPLIETDSREDDWNMSYYNSGSYFTTDNYICRIIDHDKKTASIIRMKEIEGVVTIPTKINGYKIIGIGYIYSLDDDYEDGGEVLITQCRDKIISLVIEEGTQWIGMDAFHGCTSLKEIQLPNSLKKISIRAFWDCKSLTEVIIPKNVEEIRSSFVGCTSLEKVTFKGNTILLDGSFSGCTALESITVPYGTTIINRQFDGCSNLKKLILPKSVTEIDPYRLEWQNLEKLVITNPKCKLYGMDSFPQEGILGTYDFLEEYPKLTIIAPIGSDVITLAKENWIDYKEVSLPKTPTISKTTTKNGEKTVTWKKISGVTKYQIYYSKSKNGNYTKLSETASTSFTFTKTGYIKIRGYKTYEGTKWYSSFQIFKLP